MTSLGELFVKIGIDSNDRPIKTLQQSVDTLKEKFNKSNEKLVNFENNIKNIGKSILIVKGSMLAAAYGIDRFLSNTLKGAQSLSLLSQRIGVNAVVLDKWKKAANAQGISGDALINSFENIRQNLVNIRLGQGDTSMYRMLGIDPNEINNPIQLFSQLQRKLSQVDNATASNILERFGFTAESVALLRMSRLEMDRLAGSSLLTATQRRGIEQLALSFNVLKNSLTNIKEQAIAKLTPAFQELITKSLNWLKANGSKIASAISLIVTAFGHFVVATGRAVGVVGDFINKMPWLKSAFTTLGIVVFAAFKPLYAVIAGLILLLDDFAGWKAGEDSLFGDIYEAMSKIPSIDKIIGGALAIGTLMGIVKYLKLINEKMLNLGNLNIAKSALNTAKAGNSNIVESAGKVGKVAQNAGKVGKVAQNAGKVGLARTAGIYGVAAMIGWEIGGVIQRHIIQKYLEDRQNEAITGKASNGSVLANTINNNNSNITINNNFPAGTQPQQASDTIVKGIRNAVPQLTTNQT